MVALIIAAATIVLGYCLLYVGFSNWNDKGVSFKYALTGKA